jgi:hypothetical protein
VGVIGTRLYDDDTAADVRDQWRDMVASGIDPVEATSRLIAEFGQELEDPDIAGPFWLALADTEWRAGRLEPRVLEHARGVISGPDDLNRWSGRDRERRANVLAEIGERLERPQPPARRLAPPRTERPPTDLVPGDVLAWRLPGGLNVLIWVVTLGEYLGTVPVCALLDWRGDTPPGEDEIRTLPTRKSAQGLEHFYLVQAGPRDKAPAAVAHLGRLRPEDKGRKGEAVTTWKHFPAQIIKLFGSP